MLCPVRTLPCPAVATKRQQQAKPTKTSLRITRSALMWQQCAVKTSKQLHSRGKPQPTPRTARASSPTSTKIQASSTKSWETSSCPTNLSIAMIRVVAGNLQALILSGKRHSNAMRSRTLLAASHKTMSKLLLIRQMIADRTSKLSLLRTC